MTAINSHCHLPEDLVTLILLWLPAKSLLRFKLVCKSWHAIISSPSFINRHLNHEGNQTRLVLYWIGSEYWNWHNRKSSYSYCVDETVEWHEAPDHLKLWGQISLIRGPCNGIYCIYISMNKFALWNPATRRLRLIRSCPIGYCCDMGFGIDPLTGDFKIVVLWTTDICYQIAIYTSSNDSWKYLEDEPFFDSYDCVNTTIANGNTFLDGFNYWMNYNVFSKTANIIAFEMCSEIFQKIKMPEIAESREHGQLDLYNNEFLALFSFDRSVDDKRIDIWLMKEKGYWTKLLSVVLPFKLGSPYGFLSGSNKLLISTVSTTASNNKKYPKLMMHDRNLMMYDLDSHITTKLEVNKGVHKSTHIFVAIYYKECLVSVKDKHGGIDYDARSKTALEFFEYEGPITKWAR